MNRLDMQDNPISRRRKEQVPFGVWRRLHKRYAWRTMLENIEIPPYLHPVEYFNGEIDDIYLPDAQTMESGRAVPSTMSYYYTTQRGEVDPLYSVDVIFDQDETVEAFERLASNGEQAEIVIRSDVTALVPTEVLLRTERATVRLSRAKIENQRRR